MLHNLSDNVDMQQELAKSLIYTYDFKTKLQLLQITASKRKVRGALKYQGLDFNTLVNDCEGLFIISTFWNINLRMSFYWGVLGYMFQLGKTAEKHREMAPSLKHNIPEVYPP